jgi:hypothetical protein
MFLVLLQNGEDPRRRIVSRLAGGDGRGGHRHPVAEEDRALRRQIDDQQGRAIRAELRRPDIFAVLQLLRRLDDRPAPALDGLRDAVPVTRRMAAVARSAKDPAVMGRENGALRRAWTLGHLPMPAIELRRGGYIPIFAVKVRLQFWGFHRCRDRSARA